MIDFSAAEPTDATAGPADDSVAELKPISEAGSSGDATAHLPPDPHDRLLSSYDFNLPEACIAQRPVEPRHSARLLSVEPVGGCRHLTVWDLQQQLRPGDLLVVNDTRVLKARLRARRSSGGAVELLVLEPAAAHASRLQAASAEPLQLEPADWICLARPARRLQPGQILRLEHPGEPPLELLVVGIDPASGGRVLRFPSACVDPASLEGLLARYGEMPLPPYIHGHDPADEQRYQTRYANCPGAVAAPTAGLHFSDELLTALEARGVQRATLTLHVGLGTFRPLEHEDLSQLTLHSEWVELGSELVRAVEACRRRHGRVIAVGTTSVRCLEGVAALHCGQLQPYTGPVNLVIQPGFRFGVVQGLLTNFHLPRSSLLLLVSALIGRRRLLSLYGEAISAGYRFYSYGDAMWIPPEAVLGPISPNAPLPPT